LIVRNADGSVASSTAISKCFPTHPKQRNNSLCVRKSLVFMWPIIRAY
jgi:hypothetical protein